jgi:hypothetical protein
LGVFTAVLRASLTEEPQINEVKAMDKKTAWLPVKQAYTFAIFKGLKQDADNIERFVKVKTFETQNKRDYRRALYMKLFQIRGFWQEFIQTYWQDASDPTGIKACNKYERRVKELITKYPQIVFPFMGR